MEENSVTVAAVVDDIRDVITDQPPAAGADEQKPEGDPSANGEEAAVETTEQQEARKQSKFQRRLERQKTARIQAETENRMLREQKAELEARLAQQQQPEAGEPKREQFEDYESYLRAVAKYDAKQETAEALKAARMEGQQRQAQGRQAESQHEVAKQWTEREKDFQSKTKDYLDVVQPFVEPDGEMSLLSPAARQAIVELGPEVLYELAKNPDIVERIADLSPVRQVAELGKLQTKQSTPPPKASNAPAPIAPVKAGRSSAPGYSENMSDTEYAAWRKTHGARWART
jgi:hypothetical protein